MRCLLLALLLTFVGLLMCSAVRAAPPITTPPMGWNSWNLFACKVDDGVVRRQAEAMASNGMRAAGYVYVNIDDCWQGQRNAAGELQPNARFPDMKALADYLHARGLKLGLYSSPGPKTCAGYTGSYAHEEQDARTFAAWGVDYLKYDWCSARELYTIADMPRVYRLMGAALERTGRPIVYSLCQYGWGAVWTWGAQSGGNLWRTTEDISPSFESIAHRGFAQAGLERFAGPGHFNDPDMLEVGNGSLTLDENRFHMSLWSLLSAPLLAGNDLSSMKPEILAILTQPEVIALDQDPLVRPAQRLHQEGPLSVWVKTLADGSRAVGFFNLNEKPLPARLEFHDLGVKGAALVRDVWAQRDLGRFSGSYSGEVPGHGVLLLRIGAGPSSMSHNKAPAP